MRRLALTLSGVAVLAAGTVPAQAVTVAIPPRADSTLFEHPTGQLANGGGSHVFVGLILISEVRRALLDFDIAGVVPAGAVIVDVELQLEVTRTIYPNPLAMTLHRVTASWSEGTTNAGGPEGTGAPAAPGDVTWLHRDYPTLLWANPGGDYVATPSGVSMTPSSAAAVWPSTSGMVADVQRWLDDPSTNFGWLVRTDELEPTAVRRFGSRDNAVQADRPQLLVRYLQPGNWTPAGAGCGAPAPTLGVAGNLLPGGALVLNLQGTPGALGANLLAFRLLQPAFELTPGCVLHLPPTAVATIDVRLLAADGSLQDSLAIPSAPSLAGLRLASQGAVLDPTAPTGLALSNAVFVVLP